MLQYHSRNVVSAMAVRTNIYRYGQVEKVFKIFQKSC
nr:MAG TPA: hypothetical protein [Caudoviricetes sp.]